MSMGRVFGRAGFLSLTAAFLSLAIYPGARAAQQSGGEGQSAETSDRNQQEKQEVEHVREAEAQAAEQERLDRMQELYDEGREALDEDEFRSAERSFSELVKLNGPQTDAALYWTAYAQNREGKKEAALGTIADLKKLGVTIIVVAHRPSVLADMDKMLVLQANGSMAAFGSKAEVLAQYSRSPIARPANVVPLTTAHGGSVESTGSVSS